MGLDDADIEFRKSDQYKDLERRGIDFWASVRNMPRPPQCGPPQSPFLELLVPDNVGGFFGPFGSKYNLTPACEVRDSCYSNCGATKGDCDKQLGANVFATCLSGGGSVRECVNNGNLYYWGVRYGGRGAYSNAKQESECSSCPVAR